MEFNSEGCDSRRSRYMLKIDTAFAIRGVDGAESEPPKVPTALLSGNIGIFCLSAKAKQKNAPPRSRLKATASAAMKDARLLAEEGTAASQKTQAGLDALSEHMASVSADLDGEVSAARSTICTAKNTPISKTVFRKLFATFLPTF